MKLAVPKETAEGETRVPLVPESVKKLVAANIEVGIESGAGDRAFFPDKDYEAAGARVEPHASELLSSADLVLKVRAPNVSGAGRNEVLSMKPHSMLLTSLMPTRNLEAVAALAQRGITAISTDAIPRTTRAQTMDTLSSMANIAGYKGALLAAEHLPKYFPMLMTAAGTVPPAKVFVIGAGVAGLQAIATARRIGANVFATDVRPEVKEQIESVGAKYVGVELKQGAQAGGGYAKDLSEQDKARQRELLVEQCSISDAVITTALIGGVFAPTLITAEMVRRMRPGSVIVDLAADGGGNCELSKPGSVVVESGVSIVAPLNLPATMPSHASILWSRNLTNFVTAFLKDGKLNVDLNDEIMKGAIVTHGGIVLHEQSRKAIENQSA